MIPVPGFSKANTSCSLAGVTSCCTNPVLSWATLLQGFEQHRQFYCDFLGMFFYKHVQAPRSCTPLVRGHLVSAVSTRAGSTQHDSSGAFLRVEGESLMKTCPHHFKCVFNDALHLFKLTSSLHKGCWAFIL